MLGCLVTLLWAVSCFLLDAWAIWMVWGWHGVAMGLPAISIWRAAGLSTLVNLFVLRVSTQDARFAVEAIDGGKQAQRASARTENYRRVFWAATVLGVVFFAWIAHLLARQS